MDWCCIRNFLLYCLALMLCQTTSCNRTCPGLYRRYSTNHTFCRISTCNVLRQGVTEEDKDVILNIHNKFRNKVASGNETQYHILPPAANMIEMEWDDELARVAQAHASLCLFAHDQEDARVVENFVVGQNLRYDTYEKDWNRISDWYTSEVSLFYPEYVTSYVFNKEYAHLSQMIWANTWKVGCGLSVYNESGWECTLYTCNYGPIGNIQNTSVYIEGPSCSRCPKNTTCSSHYGGLCKSETPNGPQRERPSPDDYLLYCDFSLQDPEECDSVEITESKNFSTRTVYFGNYKTLVLEEDESVTINLGEAQNDDGICPFIYARFGPNDARSTKGSVVEFSIFEEKYNYLMEFSLPSQGYYFRTYGVSMLHDAKYKINVTLKVYPDSEAQYFDVAAWGTARGECDWSL